MSRQSLRQEVANFFPGYFSLVMATGIVSLASYLLAFEPLAWLLFYVNLVAYPILWMITLARLLLEWPRVWADLGSHSRGPGFFTLVAGTCILGNQFIVIAEQPQIASWLWLFALCLWLPVTYTFFTLMTVRAEKPPLEQGLNGSWLLTIVAVQSLSVLGIQVAAHLNTANIKEIHDLLVLVALCLFLLGCMLYLLIITWIFYRFTFLVFAAASLAPPYWINMGAVAITTLAGSTLILNAATHPLLQELLPFLKGFTLFFWATATWWIPLLLILGIWRHSVQRFPFTYDPQYWGMVFPLGMYTVCTLRLALALDLSFLLIIPHTVIYFAIAAWLATMSGLLLHLARRLWARG